MERGGCQYTGSPCFFYEDLVYYAHYSSSGLRCQLLIVCMLHTTITILQNVFAVILIIAVLLQQKGAGLGMAFGGSSNIYSTKRGIDNVLFKGTIVTSILFFAVSLLMLLV